MFGWFKKRHPEADRQFGEPPISHDELKALFDYLNRRNPPKCDHSRKECVELLTIGSR